MKEKEIQAQFNEKIIVSTRFNEEIKLESLSANNKYLDDYIAFTPNQARELIKAIQQAIDEVENKKPIPQLKRLKIGDKINLNGVESIICEYHYSTTNGGYHMHDGYILASKKNGNRYRTFVPFSELSGLIN